MLASMIQTGNSTALIRFSTEEHTYNSKNQISSYKKMKNIGACFVSTFTLHVSFVRNCVVM